MKYETKDVKMTSDSLEGGNMVWRSKLPKDVVLS